MSAIDLALKIAPTLLGWLNRLWPRTCLLVVENNQIAADLMRDLIRFEGYHCEVVDTICGAEAMLAIRKYAVMFLDLRLPGGKQGWAFLNEMTNKYPNTHVVVVCGAPDDIGRISHGIYFGVILKPASNQSIRDVLRKSRL